MKRFQTNLTLEAKCNVLVWRSLTEIKTVIDLISIELLTSVDMPMSCFIDPSSLYNPPWDVVSDLQNTDMDQITKA